LKAVAEAVSHVDDFAVARAGVKLQDEENSGASNAVQVKGFIDADRKTFVAMAKTLSASADAVAAAARTRDGAKLAAVSGELDQVCESCHVRYWYPQQNQNN
jgi:cytochrome c556